ncbi:hypothetical protein AAFF_G00383840 [Aldrovandia affinis]|uniref:Transmembrane protein 70 n=1 Tax=Aldrovandia affinis TaxID=143900 RepID=A0AAD7SF66_9TELE|nr:hypothetical protein AAFF_G00383840 [Aldrovandia affinis]
MLRLYRMRAMQSFSKWQPVLTQSCYVGHMSRIRCFNTSSVSGKSPYTCVSLRNQGNLLQYTRRPVFSNIAINKQVQPSPVHKTLRCFFSSTSSSNEGQLIYTGTMGKAILGVKFFSYSSSMFSLCMMPYILLKTGIGTQNLALLVAFCSIIGAFTFITPVLLHLITKGYVVRLYHNHDTDTYTAVTYSALLVEKKTMFHQREVSVPDVSRMFTSFYANRKSMLVNPMLFPLPQDYNHLMGYDKPFSFSMEELDKPDGSKHA